MSRLRYGMILVAIVTIGALGRLLHYEAVVSPDEEMYLEAAKLLSHPDAPPVPAEYRPRILWIWTLNAWGRMAGLTLHSAAVLMFIFSSASILLTAAIARRVFGATASLVAAGIVGFYYPCLLYDPRIYPDGQAIVVMLASVLLFLRYQESRRIGLLIAAATLAGMLLPIKEYYVLIALPLAWSLWFEATRREPRPTMRHRSLEFALAALCLAVGMSSSCLLHFIASGDPLGQFHHPDYAKLLLERDLAAGDRSLYGIVAKRFSYFRYLLLDNGIVGGLLLVFGGAYLAAVSRNRRECRLILCSAVLFFVFLSLMPASLKPFMFVAAQARYTVVFIPFLAIGAGGAMSAAFLRLHEDRVLYACGWLGLAVVAAINLWLPNYRYGSFSKGPPVGKALTATIERGSELGISTLVLPWDDWQAKVTEPFYDRKVKLVLADRGNSQSAADYGRIESILKRQQNAAVFVPISMAQDENIRPLNCDVNYRRVAIMVPGSSISSWLSAIKGSSGDMLAGYLYVKK